MRSKLKLVMLFLFILKHIQEMFGEDAHKYCILVLTGEDNLTYDGTKS
jgi:hypothetical protein